MSIKDRISQISKLELEQRSNSQMTLGELIVKLDTLDSDFEIERIGNPDCYFCYYTDLAFEPQDGRITAGELLPIVRSCLGPSFTGYTGGEFTMTKTTPLWIAPYGSCGVKIIGLNGSGEWIVE